ncbi:hypothetical protein NQ318_004710 [Aromia moschata]|uniref:Integrase catalytic domain-containing protein n=1 Tax=Aromia moschata TaxID=1265417 RepID=A0AAV8X254_9CUCU|nr:hypothetical protein NQ318_004710 [Aromia moschata]
MERKLEDTRRQVQKEILEKINGLEHQLHRTSIADSGDCPTSPATPLQHSSLMHTERSVHKMLKPPTYDGQSSWSMYRRQFEAAAKANGWTPQEMATSLVISLRGQALEILQSIPEEQQNDYDRIVGALEISPKSRVDNKEPMSPFKEYEADIERLVHLAYPQAPKEFLEQIGIQTFIDGLLDTEMQQALRLGRHTTICDALIAALEFKAAKEASRSYKSLREIRKTTISRCYGRVSTTGTQSPKISVSDKGNDVEGEQHDERVGDIKKTRTTALHPQSNGMVERHNRTICHYLSKFVSENQRDWDKLVPLFLLSYRSSQHESTTYTPSMLTSGREMKLPTDLMLGRPLEEEPKSDLPEFVEDLRKRMDRIHRFARENLKIHSDKMKQRLDTTSTETALKPGDAVWLYAPKRTKGKCPKLQSNWEGPYTIIKKTNDLVYRIQLSPRSKPKVVHLERLMKYTGHNPPNWFVVEDPPPRTEDSVIRDE